MPQQAKHGMGDGQQTVTPQHLSAQPDIVHFLMLPSSENELLKEKLAKPIESQREIPQLMQQNAVFSKVVS